MNTRDFKDEKLGAVDVEAYSSWVKKLEETKVQNKFRTAKPSESAEKALEEAAKDVLKAWCD